MMFQNSNNLPNDSITALKLAFEPLYIYEYVWAKVVTKATITENSISLSATFLIEGEDFKYR